MSPPYSSSTEQGTGLDSCWEQSYCPQAAWNKEKNSGSERNCWERLKVKLSRVPGSTKFSSYPQMLYQYNGVKSTPSEMYWFPRAAITKDHKRSGPQEHTCVPSQFWSPEIPNPGVSRTCPLWDPGESLPWPLPNFRWLQTILGLTITRHSSLCLHQHTALSLSVSVFRFPLSCKDTSHSGFRAHSNPAW